MDEIVAQIKVLSQMSEGFAAKRMDQAIKKALAGQHLSDFDSSSDQVICDDENNSFSHSPVYIHQFSDAT